MRGAFAALWLFGAVVLLPPTVARADEDEARWKYKLGEAHLKAERYRAAIEAFAAGYAADPRPGFLLNIANCHRKLGELGRARTHYRRFLEAAPKEHAARAEVIAYLRAIDEIEADGVELDPPDLRSEAMAPSAGALAAGASSDAAGDLAVVSRREEPAADNGSPIWTRWWFWTAATAVVAASVGTALILRPEGARTTRCDADLGCFAE